MGEMDGVLATLPGQALAGQPQRVIGDPQRVGELPAELGEHGQRGRGDAGRKRVACPRGGGGCLLGRAGRAVQVSQRKPGEARPGLDGGVLRTGEQRRLRRAFQLGLQPVAGPALGQQGVSQADPDGAFDGRVMPPVQQPAAGHHRVGDLPGQHQAARLLGQQPVAVRVVRSHQRDRPVQQAGGGRRRSRGGVPGGPGQPPDGLAITLGGPPAKCSATRSGGAPEPASRCAASRCSPRRTLAGRSS